ncbi:MFS transporter [Actinophytocola sp.]|uniref:MFS transporter n=1 Tax=Actinophytocola sp. TaxID=1872138 RepID=UPI002D3081A8|nr:MFS transporter [Actinophytocola sp.]HYQ68695.1 MFS transporter [Actinophytocola sp.]
MSGSSGTSAPAASAEAATASRGAILTTILAVQLLNTIDITVMNMALPQIRQSLDMSPTALSWVINSYALAYGGLLLLGGRTGDILGHRRALMIGVSVFTLASLLGGLAQAPWWLLTARTLQGMGAALAAPTTMALIVRIFTDATERTKALGISVMASGIGSAGGLLLGGLLTDAGSWRWVLFINVPVGVAILLVAPRVIPPSAKLGGRFDLGGALSASLGMTALVYGFVRAAESGWTDPMTVVAFAVGVLLLASLVLIESKHAQPIVRLGLFADRNRSGGFAVFVCSGAAMFGMYFFFTQYVQDVLGMSPLVAGLAFLPMALPMIVVPRTLTPKLVNMIGAKPTMLIGLAAVATSMLWLSRLSPTSTYFEVVFGPMAIAGAGVGLLNAPLAATILAAVAPKDAGGASGLLQTVGMIGGSTGTAILVTIFGTTVRDDPRSATLGPTSNEVLSHGIAAACLGGLTFAIVGFLIVLVVLRPAPRKRAEATS